MDATSQPLPLTPGWLDARLEALSADLLLACPTLDGFVFPAEPAWLARCATPEGLEATARRLLEHLRLPVEAVAVRFAEGLDVAGQLERQGGRYSVELAARHKGDGRACAAILARQFCQALLEDRGLVRTEPKEDLLHVDLAAVLSGLGPLLLLGAGRGPGLLNAPQLGLTHGRVSARLGLGWRRAARYLSGLDRAMVATQYALGAQARLSPLSYGDPGEVLAPCLGPTCTARLRIPLGKAGTARCPACGTAREFDAHTCRAEIRTVRRKLEAQPRPVATAALRLRARAAAVPFGQRLVLGFSPFLLVLLSGAGTVRHALLPGLGGACLADGACRSALCLHTSELAFARPVLHGLPSEGGYCTRDCEASADCPEAYECAEAREDRAGHDPEGRSAGGVRRVCVRK